MGALVKFEPIPPLDQRQPTQIASDPAWLESQKSAVLLNEQPIAGQIGFQEVMTLPEALMPTQDQRRMIADHCDRLKAVIEQTPKNNQIFEKATLVLIDGLMMVLQGRNNSEDAAELTAEAYMIALDDVASWAVEAAIHRWYKGQSGKDEHGNSFNYSFRPDPASLRRLAKIEEWRIRNRVRTLEPILKAVVFIDTRQICERGALAFSGLMACRGDADKIKELTFDKAVEIGRTIHPKKSDSKGGSDGNETRGT